MGWHIRRTARPAAFKRGGGPRRKMVQKGERNFREKDWNNPNSLSESDVRLQRQVAAFSLATAVIVVIAVAYVLMRQFLVGTTYWTAFVGGIAIGWIALAIGVVMMVTACNSAASISKAALAVVTGAEVGVGAVASRITAVHVALTLGIMAGAWWAGVGVTAVAAAVLGALVGTVTGALAGVLAKEKAKAIGVAIAGALVPVAAAIVIAGPVGVAAAIGVVPTIVGFAAGILLVTIGIRFLTTLCYLRAGIKALPRNFRRLMFCTSPGQPPELVPGLVEGESSFTFQDMLGTYRRQNDLLSQAFFFVLLLSWFVPGWFYRACLKSTIWFWAPLAYLGAEPKRAKDPGWFYQEVTETLWARATLGIASITILVFSIINFAGMRSLPDNPLLNVLGFLFVIDWSLRSWQVLALLGAILSLTILFLINKAFLKYRHAKENQNKVLLGEADREFQRVELLARFRRLFIIAYWALIAAHGGLYVNSRNCWWTIPASVQSWSECLYGNHAPPPPCSDRLAQEVRVNGGKGGG